MPLSIDIEESAVEQKSREEILKRVENFAQFCSDERHAQLSAKHLAENDLTEILELLTAGLGEHDDRLMNIESVIEGLKGNTPYQGPHPFRGIKPPDAGQIVRINALHLANSVTTNETPSSNFKPGPRVKRLPKVLREERASVEPSKDSDAS